MTIFEVVCDVRSVRQTLYLAGTIGGVVYLSALVPDYSWCRMYRFYVAPNPTGLMLAAWGQDHPLTHPIRFVGWSTTVTRIVVHPEVQKALRMDRNYFGLDGYPDAIRMGSIQMNRSAFFPNLFFE